MRFIDKLEAKRCENCPAHYGGFNGEDYDDGCEIFGYYEEKVCPYFMLPRWIIRLFIKRCSKDELKRLEEWANNWAKDNELWDE